MKNTTFCCAIFLVVLGVYLRTLSPTVTSDDSGEFVGVTSTLGIAHPSGYPVYSIFGKIIDTIIPFGSHAYRTNFVASFFGALAVSVLPLTIFAVAAAASFAVYISAAAASFLLAFSEHFWNMGIVTEVYTINAFFALLLILVLNQSSLNSKLKVYLASFIFGFGLGGHHTLVLLAPAILLWLWFNRKEINFSPLTVVNLLIFFLLGLLIYIFIPLRASTNPLFSWEDPRTFERFIGLVKRARYGGNLMQGKPLALNLKYILNQFVLYGIVLHKGMTTAGVILIAFSSIFAFIHYFKRSAVLLTIALFTGPVFFIMARAPIGPSIIDLLERFVYLSYIPLCMLTGMGMSVFLTKFFNNNKFIPVLLLIIPFSLLYKNFANLNRQKDFVYYDYSRNILKTVPYNSILFSDRADESDFVIAYLTRIQGYRSDIDYTECNAGVSKSIYGDDYYYIWGKPRLEIREKKEKEIIASTNKQVYYSTVLPGQVNIPKIKEGMLYKVVKNTDDKGKYIDWDEIYALRFPLHQDLRSNNMYSSYFNILAGYYADFGRPDKVEKMYTICAQIGHDKKGLLTIPWMYFEKGDYKAARKKYEELLKINPRWEEALVNLGVVYEKLNMFKEAKNNYLIAIEANPGYAQSYYNLAVLYWRENDFKKVVQYFSKVMELQPNNAEARKFLEIAKQRISG